MSQLSHLLREGHANTTCLYCGSEKDIMASEFHEEMHYLSFTCKECNRSNFIKVDFMSSGINIPYDQKEKKPLLEQIIVKEPVLK
jgi:hypothetical protein